MKKAEITIFLVPNFFKSGNTLINEKISQPYDDHQSFLGLAANKVQNLSTSRGRHLSVSDWSLWCALNQNCIGVKSKLGETLLGEDPLYVLCIYLLYEINITTLISILYCSVAEYIHHRSKGG